jgi:hypothetical protein
MVDILFYQVHPCCLASLAFFWLAYISYVSFHRQLAPCHNMVTQNSHAYRNVLGIMQEEVFYGYARVLEG